jgi:hypothetical protein
MSKAELKAAAKTRIAAATDAIGAALDRIETETAAYLRRVGVFEVQAGVGLAEVRATFADAKAAKVSLAKTAGIGTDDWREKARELVPGKSMPTLYRWTNAGAVANVLGEDLAGGALVGSLVPLYRILTAAKTAEERTAAEELVREVYGELKTAAGLDEDGEQVPPTESDAKTAAEKASPTNRSGGGTAPDEDADESDEDEDEDEDSRRETAADLVTVSLSPEDLLNVKNTVGAFVRATADELKIDRAAVQAILAWGAMAAKEHGGPDAILASLS